MFSAIRLLLALLVLTLAVAPLSAAASEQTDSPALPAGVIAPLNWTFTAVEGQSYSGNVAAFTDSDNVTASNFQFVVINWGDGGLTTGLVQRSGIDTHLFFVSGTHAYAEEGSHAVSISFHDVLDNVNKSLNNSAASVQDAPLCACATVAPGTPTTFSGVGGTFTAGSALNAENAFKAAIGGADNGAIPLPQTSGFRLVYWDGVRLDGTDFGGDSLVIDLNKTVGIPVNRYQERGAYFGRVYAVSNAGFRDVNPAVTGVLTDFTPLNDFAPFNSHEVDLDFVAASVRTTSPAPAGVRGFGAIFVNVHNPQQTSIEYFAGLISLGKYYVPVGGTANPSYVFQGVLFNQPIVTHVHLTLGDGTIFYFDGTTYAAGASDNPTDGTNVVALDDFVYSEPQPVAAAPAPTITASLGVPFTGAIGTFADGDANANANDFTATIDWGDGHSSPGQVSATGAGGFRVSGTNTYAQGGTFHITFTVQDLGGAQVSGNSTAKVTAFLFLPLIRR